MAMRISANFHSKCIECEEEWEKGEKIYWDPDTKNKKGKSPTCITYHCYQAQGGADISEEASSGKEDLTFIIPVETAAFESDEIVLEKILAHYEVNHAGGIITTTYPSRKVNINDGTVQEN